MIQSTIYCPCDSHCTMAQTAYVLQTVLRQTAYVLLCLIVKRFTTKKSLSPRSIKHKCHRKHKDKTTFSSNYQKSDSWNRFMKRFNEQAVVSAGESPPATVKRARQLQSNQRTTVPRRVSYNNGASTLCAQNDPSALTDQSDPGNELMH